MARSYSVNSIASSEPKEEEVENNNNPTNISVEGIRISPNQIPHGIYRQEQNENRRTSPSASEINFSLS